MLLEIRRLQHPPASAGGEVVVEEPFDSGSLDALADLSVSPGYALVRERIEKEIERKREDLETVPANLRGAGSIEGLQGHIKALRTVLAMPGILKSEIKGQLDKEQL